MARKSKLKSEEELEAQEIKSDEQLASLSEEATDAKEETNEETVSNTPADDATLVEENEEIITDAEQITEESENTLEESEEATEELPEEPEIAPEDARYLSRESVIFDENAPDAITEEAPYDETVDEMYSLPFFEDEEEEKPVEIKKEEEPEKEQEPYNPEKPRRVDARFDFVELFIFTLAIVLFVTSFIIRHSVVVGASMENTLYEGERLLISDLFYTPDYGDIIVFEDYSTNVKTAVVKRVIGLPGDTIRIMRNGSVYRNDELLIEEYVFIDDKNYQYQELYTVVPEGELFVMGDHRNNSDDSRVFGTVDEDSVLGRVLLRFYPFDRFGNVD